MADAPIDPRPTEDVAVAMIHDPIASVASAPHRAAIALLAELIGARPELASVRPFLAAEALIAEMDQRIDAQIHAILHHGKFQSLEATWRGLRYLVHSLARADTVKVRVLDISKDDLRKTLKKYRGFAWDTSPMFRKVYEEEFGMPGGQPYGCLIGDYEFSHVAPDVEMLSSMAQIAAAAHCPFLSAASPHLLNMDTWQELEDPRDLTKLVRTPEYVPWRALRESEDARYLGLTLPRVLARVPYGAKTDPVDRFDFEELAEGPDHRRFVWTSSVYAFARVIGRAFARHGWCARIRGIEAGGLVDDLPVYSLSTGDGDVDLRCPTEIAITPRREAELAQFGLIPLCHVRSSATAAFIGAQSLQQPTEYSDADATANAILSSRLPYVFPTCRFAHYLKCMVRDRVGSYQDAKSLQRWIHNWIQDYVTTDTQASEEVKAERPLARAEVEVEADESKPGEYRCKLFLRPHFQLEGLSGSLRLVSRLQSVSSDRT